MSQTVFWLDVHQALMDLDGESVDDREVAQ